MADFRTHITTSSAIGVIYGVAGHLHWQIPIPTCVVASSLCGLAGMLPDMDSDSGHAQREIMTFAAAVTPMLMISLPSTPIFGGTKHWFTAYPFMASFAGPSSNMVSYAIEHENAEAQGAFSDKLGSDPEWQEFWQGVNTADPSADMVSNSLAVEVPLG